MYPLSWEMSDISLIDFTINLGYRRNLAINTFKSDHMFLTLRNKKNTTICFLYKGLNSR